MSVGFTCATCGAFHEGYPMCYGPSAPELWYTIPEEERESRCELSSDQCIVDDKYFFVLGRVEIPIIETGEEFVWLAWVSLSEKNFERACELWEAEGRETESPCFAWFSSALPYEKTTLHLEAILHTRPLGERPAIELQECDHPLYAQQRHGMSLAELQALPRGWFMARIQHKIFPLKLRASCGALQCALRHGDGLSIGYAGMGLALRNALA